MLHIPKGEAYQDLAIVFLHMPSLTKLKKKVSELKEKLTIVPTPNGTYMVFSSPFERDSTSGLDIFFNVQQKMPLSGMCIVSGEVIMSRYVAEPITTDAGRFGHVGLCQLRTKLKILQCALFSFVRS